MMDWMRFSVAFWHTFRGSGADPFGSATKIGHGKMVPIHWLWPKEEVRYISAVAISVIFASLLYMHGAATSSEVGVYAYAAAQVKKAMEVGVIEHRA
ncbi:hypothetical protein QYF36_017140 [Acer negundo]|nr:hypothetical protein QYF36_017140 [Acer negundo]